MSTFSCPDLEATRALGVALAAAAPPGLVVALRGPLGAGKTSLAQGVGQGLDIDEPVTSPTFVLVAEYEGRLPLLHADLYRLQAEELAAIGLEEQLETWPGLALVEWPERAPGLLPDDHLDLQLAILPDDARTVTLTAHGPRARAALDALLTQLPAGSGAARG